MEEPLTCPRCNGAGETGPILACGPKGSQIIDKAPCWMCKGSGSVSAEQSEHMNLGELVRAERIRQRIPSARLAAYLGEDRVSYSKAESLGVGDARTFDRMRNWLDSQPKN